MDTSENNQAQDNSPKPGLDDHRKLFVGGLTPETTEDEVRNHFSQFGEVQSVSIKMNPQTSKSKGFGFVVFVDPDSVDKALAQKNQMLNNKAIDVKKAKTKPGKIFVGGITPELTDEDIKTYFQQFGNVTQVEMPFDKTKNQRKAFCFITFESEVIVRDLLKKPKQMIKDKQVDVKRAATQPDQRGGRGGGRGGYWGSDWGYGGGGYGGGYGDYYGGGYGDGYGYNGYGPGGGYGDGYGAGGGYGPGGGYGGPAPGGRGGPRGGAAGGKPPVRGGGRGRGRGAGRVQPY